MRYRPSGFLTTRFLTLLVFVFEGTLHSLCMRINYVEAFDLPRVEGEHRPVQPFGERYLAQRPPTCTDGDHAVRGRDDDRVARLAEPGGQCQREVRVGSAAVGVGEDADHRPALAGRAFARRAHNAAESTVEDDGAVAREQPPHLACRFELRWRRLRGATDRDISKSRHRGTSLFGKICGEVQRPWGKGGEAELWINRVVVPAASFAS